MSNVTVLGATGGIGRAVTLELATRGHAVTAVNRRGDAGVPAGVRTLAADLSDRGAALAAGAGADVVVMAANVPYQEWGDRLVRVVTHALEAAAAAGARLVMADNLYAYGSPGVPITEDTRESATSRKGALRRALGQQLLQAHREGRARVVIGRCSDYYGPGGTNAMLYVLGFARALAGKAPRVMLDADQPHTFHYLPDAARGFAVLVERPEADGQVWILPAAVATTQRDLLSLVAAEAGAPSKLGRVSRPLLALGGVFSPQIRELRELADQWDRPYVTDASAFEEAFGPIPVTPHEHAVAETVAAFRAGGGQDSPGA